MIKRAINGGWNITDEKRAEVVEELMDIVHGPNRTLAVQAARILQSAVADDRRHELGILMILQRDQEDVMPAYGGTVNAQAVRNLEEADTTDIHAYMERISGVEPRMLPSDDED